jgi:dihydrofolate reductase
MRLTAHTFLTLDGVMQAPGGTEEDTSGGFTAGGWQAPFFDDDSGRIVGGWFDRLGAMLIGRRTYEAMAPYWSQVTDPGIPINDVPKYVASSTLTDPTWKNTSVLGGDAVERVRELKARSGDGELQVHGSGQLLRSLTAAGLVDEYRIMVFPVVVGGGKRLFGTGTPASGFDVVDSAVTKAGATYTALVPRPFTTATYVVHDGRQSTTQATPQPL